MEATIKYTDAVSLPYKESHSEVCAQLYFLIDSVAYSNVVYAKHQIFSCHVMGLQESSLALWDVYLPFFSSFRSR